MILLIHETFINLEVIKAYGFAVKNDPNSKLYFWYGDYESLIKLPDNIFVDRNKMDVLVLFRNKLNKWLSDTLDFEKEYNVADIKGQIDYLVKEFREEGKI